MSELCAPLAHFISSLDTPLSVPKTHAATYFQTLLYLAVKQGNSAAAEHILQHHGVHANIRNNRGETPLFLAAFHGHDLVCEVLLRYEADVHMVDFLYQRPPLFVAAANAHEKTVCLLIEHGAKLDYKDGNGQSPLSRAAEGGHDAIVVLLRAKGADIHAPDAYMGQTPLSWAAAGGFSSVVKTLLDAGADINAKDEGSDTTALSWAARNGHLDTVKFLIAEGAKVVIYDTYFRSPLSFAAGYGHEEVVKFLLQAGSELEPKYRSVAVDYRPLVWAKREGYIKVVEILEERLTKVKQSVETTTPSVSNRSVDGLSQQLQQLPCQHPSTSSSDGLCERCSGLDFTKYFTQSVHKGQPNSTPRAHANAICLGPVSDLVLRSTSCPFCQLVVEALCLRWRKSRKITVDDLADKKDIKVSIYSYTSANYGQVGFNESTPAKSAAYSIGLQTTRPLDSDHPWPHLLEGQIALVKEDAVKPGQQSFGQGRIVPDGQADRTLLKSWLEECENHHGAGCHLEVPPHDIAGLLLIDTSLMCLVDASSQRYVALSYCWGSASMFKLVKANETPLKTPNALREIWDQIPRTIQDAIQLCRDIGEKYLWVDSLCIVQDDDERKAIQIS